MSLIYSALSKLDQAPAAQASAMQHEAPALTIGARTPGAPRWVWIIAIGCVLVVLGGWLARPILRDLFAALQVRTPDKVSAVPQAPVVALKSDAVTPPLPAVERPPELASTTAPATEPTAAPAIAPIIASMQPSVPAMPSAGAVAAAMHVADSMPAQAPPVSPAMQDLRSGIDAAAVTPAAEPKTIPLKTPPAALAPPRLPARAGKTPPAAAEPDAAVAKNAAREIDPDEINALSLAIKRALQSGKNTEADALLVQLGARLPAESITLLRLRAWHKMQSGDAEQATTLYRQIVARLPDDEAASVNLARLYWQAGQQEEARRLIATLAERHPESEAVRAYGMQFGAPR